MFRVSFVPGILAAAILSCPLPAMAQQDTGGSAQLPATVPDSLPAIAPPMPETGVSDTPSANDGAEDPAQLQSELEAARAELDALREQLSDADEAPPSEAATPTAPGDTETPAGLPPPGEPATGAPRDPALVASVVETAPGVPTDPATQERLRDLLVQGVCAPDALAQVQDPINRQTLLALMTRLPRC